MKFFMIVMLVLAPLMAASAVEFNHAASASRQSEIRSERAAKAEQHRDNKNGKQKNRHERKSQQNRQAPREARPADRPQP